jgi:protein-tyrosine phosphatase
VRLLRRLAGRTPRADYGRVAPWLLLGPALDDAGYEALAREGVTHVLDLRSEASDDPDLMRRLHLAWRRVPIEDRAAPTGDQLNEINRWLDETQDPQPVVYVHCQGGLGRSPTIAVALLMRRGFSRAEAHRFVQTARSVAAPTDAQDSWLAELEAAIRRGERTG